jgi:hypothetical protein
MGRWFVAAVIAAGVVCAGCASAKYSSDKEWARAECGRIIDEQARERCLRRVAAE